MAAQKAKEEVKAVLCGSPSSRRRTLAPWVRDQAASGHVPAAALVADPGVGPAISLIDIVDGVDHFRSGYHSQSVMASRHLPAARDDVKVALEVAQKQLQESQRQVEEGKALHQKLLGIISEQAETIAELKREFMEAREVQERDVSVRGDGEEQEDDLQPDYPTVAR